MFRRKTSRHIRTIKSLVKAIGIVLVWRGIWYLFDLMDVHFFGGSHIWTAGIGILAGLALLYAIDEELEELS